MAFDSYLKLEGVKGSAQAKGFDKAIEIYSFSFGASNPVTIGSGSAGAGAGKVSLSSFNVMKKSDEASPQLFQACCNGQHFDKASITLRKAGGEQNDFLLYEFGTVFIESIQWSGSSGGDDTPTESIALAFASVNITYTPQDAKGVKGTPVVASWDLQKVTKLK